MRTTSIIIAIAVVLAAGIIVYAIRSGSPEASEYDLGSGTGSEENQPITNTPMDGELKIEDVKVGVGKEAKAGDVVSVHYVGTFLDGKKFDSSRDRGAPFSFTLGAGAVIKGWDQGVAGMKEGGVRKLVIPPQLGYGMSDYGSIPGGSTLLFEVELLKVASQ